MGDVNFGFSPASCVVHLTRGADFTCTLVYTVDGVDTNWPTGTTVTLNLGDVTTVATISGAAATFFMDKAVADTVERGTSARVLVTNGTSDQIWYVGTVARPHVP